MTYAVNLEIFPDQLQFAVTPDGVHHGKIDLKLVVYDSTGKVLRSGGGRFALTLSRIASNKCAERVSGFIS